MIIKPTRMHTDQGTGCLSQLVRDFLQINKVKLVS